MTTNIVVWHRNDLRVRDNAALAVAAAEGTAHPVFVFDPHFYRSEVVCDGRIEFLHESLDQLAAEYNGLGGTLAFRHGSAEDVLDELLDDADCLYFNAAPSAGYARERDERIAAREDVRTFGDDAIVRDGDSRSNWQKQAEAYFTADPHDPPDTVGSNVDSTATISDIEAEYDIDSTKERTIRGGCRRGRERLETFVGNIDEYIGGISPPAAARERTSRLSPYLKFGCLSLREVYQHADDEGMHNRAVEMFHSRLFWNQHFRQKLQDNPTATEHAVNPVFRGMNRDRHDSDLARAWKRGQTGFPMIDASMRALRETGWLNFRMRAMCASFYSYILRCWWKPGADWYYRHLIDAEPGINYQQWQMQSGLVGVHPLRIYNPRKQVRENDPDGEFIREFVPELADLPADFLPRPEKTPLSVQQECGVRIGEDYPLPVVDFERRRREARETWAGLDDRAKEALTDPAIRRRASLSQRRDRSASDVEDGTEPTAEQQTDLSSFGE
ncbi:deoxyribodipyrimidine photo-lyase/cryptochrome family protein [Halovenus sp. HT40]|uniref:deoxyribodipyrimidine photo-lyase/cryptochrome family protein n=1 Tax=Halovenus sp. HT40 TaxID=3126691 RepID=UPI00300ED4B4